MKNYRILQIHNFYQIPGGEDVVVRNEKRLLEEHGHKVYTYCCSCRLPRCSRLRLTAR